MNHPIQCRCGAFRGHVSHTDKVSRGVCYCRSCQAFAHYLGKPGDVLDEMGGTDVVATLPRYVTFTQGREALACMSLSEKGMLRWYASCCDTAIGNTPRDYRFSHIGLIHTCLEDPARTLDAAFGPVRMRVNAKHARGKPESMTISTITSIVRFLGSVIRARLDGSYRNTPFFSDRGSPVVVPKVLTSSERDRVMAELGG